MDPREKKEAIILSIAKCTKVLQIQDRAWSSNSIFSVFLASDCILCSFLTSLETKHDYVLPLQQHLLNIKKIVSRIMQVIGDYKWKNFLIQLEKKNYQRGIYPWNLFLLFSFSPFKPVGLIGTGIHYYSLPDKRHHTTWRQQSIVGLYQA